MIFDFNRFPMRLPMTIQILVFHCYVVRNVVLCFVPLNGGKMAKIDTLFMTKTAEKPYPLGLHKYIAHIRESPHPPGVGRPACFYQVKVHWTVTEHCPQSPFKVFYYDFSKTDRCLQSVKTIHYLLFAFTFVQPSNFHSAFKARTGKSRQSKTVHIFNKESNFFGSDVQVLPGSTVCGRVPLSVVLSCGLHVTISNYLHVIQVLYMLLT